MENTTDNNADKNANKITLPSIRDLRPDLTPSPPQLPPPRVSLPRISAPSTSPDQSTLPPPSPYLISSPYPPPRQHGASPQHPYPISQPQYISAYHQEPVDYRPPAGPNYYIPPAPNTQPYAIGHPHMVLPPPGHVSSRYVSKSSSAWSPEDDKLLRMLKEEKNYGWREIASYFPNRTINACQFRWRRLVVGVAGKKHSDGSVSPKSARSKLRSRENEDSDTETAKEDEKEDEKDRDKHKDIKAVDLKRLLN
ncbi:hypothetical protein KL934_000445 [Ogataea polymorpha]|nr:hypothetical protein KL934_000445 [Ogataea polymorpha]